MSRAAEREQAHAEAVERLLTEVRAALAAGAAPSAALAAGIGVARELAPDDAVLRTLADVLAPARLGAPLSELAGELATGDVALDLLVRALAVVEVAGAGALVALEQALEAAAQSAALRRLLRTRTAQARGNAKVLVGLPLVGTLLVALLDPALLAFYLTPLGAGVAVVAGLLTALGGWWARRIASSGARPRLGSDPLVASRPPPRWSTALAAAGPAALVIGLVAGPLMGVVALLAVGLPLALAGRPTPDLSGGGSSEAVELVGVAVGAGLEPSHAVTTVAPLAPPAARPALTAAGGALRTGSGPREAFAGTGLERLGAVLDASARWGAPARPALTRLATDLRAARRAAAEEAAERVEVRLVFPVTVLLLPAFLLAMVPPVLWSVVEELRGLGTGI